MSNKILRAAGLFQAIATIPVALILGSQAFFELYDYYPAIYRFLTYTVNGLLAVLILFILLLQHQFQAVSSGLTLILEITKSILATAMWLWLLLDSALVDHGNGYREPSNDTFVRVVRALITGLALLVLFYPTVAYAAYVVSVERKEGRVENGGEERAEEDGERAPLLSREG